MSKKINKEKTARRVGMFNKMFITTKGNLPEPLIRFSTALLIRTVFGNPFQYLWYAFKTEVKVTYLYYKNRKEWNKLSEEEIENEP